MRRESPVSAKSQLFILACGGFAAGSLRNRGVAAQWRSSPPTAANARTCMRNGAELRIPGVVDPSTVFEGSPQGKDDVRYRSSREAMRASLQSV